MKREGNLKERIVDIDNVALAAHKAFRGKRGKAEVRDFVKDFSTNISALRDDIESGNIIIGNYHYFTIFDPKERVICAADLKERILHHSIMNICHSRFDKALIYDTYATRPGKGVYAALDKARLAMCRYSYYAKLDVRKYYDNIDHTILKDIIRRLFKDKWLLALFDRIIDSYSVRPGKGIPIGNLTSQYFANIYMSGLDHYMKETLSVPVYIRYMDDVLVCCDDKCALHNYVSSFINYASCRTKLEIKQPQFGKCTTGVSFLGYKVLPGYMLLNGRSKKRFRAKFLEYSRMHLSGELTEKELSLRLVPLLAFTRHARSRTFRKDCIAMATSKLRVIS